MNKMMRMIILALLVAAVIQLIEAIVVKKSQNCGLCPYLP